MDVINGWAQQQAFSGFFYECQFNGHEILGAKGVVYPFLAVIRSVHS